MTRLSFSFSVSHSLSELNVLQALGRKEGDRGMELVGFGFTIMAFLLVVNLQILFKETTAFTVPKATRDFNLEESDWGSLLCLGFLGLGVKVGHRTNLVAFTANTLWCIDLVTRLLHNILQLLLDIPSYLPKYLHEFRT